MKFEQFCLRKAYKGPLEPGDSAEIPERYAVPVESLISTLKNKVHILDKVNVPFVEAVFDDDYESILGEKLVDGEVPDGIIIRLSEGLYNNYPSKLDSNQQAIIKVLSAYICIQN